MSGLMFSFENAPSELSSIRRSPFDVKGANVPFTLGVNHRRKHRVGRDADRAHVAAGVVYGNPARLECIQVVNVQVFRCQIRHQQVALIPRDGSALGSFPVRTVFKSE